MHGRHHGRGSRRVWGRVVAYPIVCTPCLDEQHDSCIEWSKIPLQETVEFVCGGAFCICITCKPMDNCAWYEEVLARSRESHDRA